MKKVVKKVGLTKAKKELLEKLIGSASSKQIDFNKVRDEYRQNEGEVKMINKERLREIMSFILEEYPDSCASINWERTGYKDIVEGKVEIEDYEVEHIVEECIDEFVHDLRLCGCGSPEHTIEVVRLVLAAQNQDKWGDKKLLLDNICGLDSRSNYNYNGLIQFVLYILDNRGFLEHGGSIGGAWLTEKGELFLELLNMNEELENNDLE